MENMDDQELRELLFELGYDEFIEDEEDGWKYNRFVRQQDREARREAQSYLDELDECYEDSYYIRLKNIG